MFLDRKDPSQSDVASKKAMFEKVAADERPPWAIKGKASYKIRNKIAKMFSEKKPQISLPKAAETAANNVEIRSQVGH